jgi:hypothetical protein
VLVVTVVKEMFVCIVTGVLWLPTEAAAVTAASAQIKWLHDERYKVRQVYCLMLQVQI